MAIRKPIANNSGTLSELPDGDGLGVDYLALEPTAGHTPLEGELSWNADEGTVGIGLNGGDAEYYSGQQTIYRVINQSGSQINKGVLCMYAGTVGASGKLKVVPWDGTSPPLLIMGIALEDIPTENEPTETGLGYVVSFGKVQKINTTGSLYGETWTNGDVLYAGPTGGLTNVLPIAPSTKTVIAAVVNAHASVGELLVRVTLSSSIANDDAVEITSIQNGDVLIWNATNQRFQNGPQTGGGGGGGVTVSSTEPVGASDGDLWFDTTTLTLKVYYDGEWRGGLPLDWGSITDVVAFAADWGVVT